MNKDEVFETKTYGLELKGGYHGRSYPQKFVYAPLSQHPSPAPSSGKKMPYGEAIRMTLGKK